MGADHPVRLVSEAWHRKIMAIERELGDHGMGGAVVHFNVDDTISVFVGSWNSGAHRCTPAELRDIAAQFIAVADHLDGVNKA